MTRVTSAARHCYYEFFAGGGMARHGLGAGWRCLFANDVDAMKAASYAANWGDGDLVCADVRALGVADLPGRADLAWASFPCQDLSLAGEHAGLGAARSGTFWAFWSLMTGLARVGRAPGVIAIENVAGLLTSHGGRDFAAIGRALAGAGYRFGALVIDAALFVPQSRPRVFIVAARTVPPGLVAPAPALVWHPRALLAAHAGLDPDSAAAWVWWDLPEPDRRVTTLADAIDPALPWHTEAETARLLAMMAPLHRARVAAAQASGGRQVGAVYRRTRPDGTGGKAQRAEVRFDGLSGCLRTPAGGSSRQTILVAEGPSLRSRLLSAREAARLMGLDDGYTLPERYSDAYRLAGDGVCSPVVRHLARHLLEPLALRRADVGAKMAAPVAARSSS